MAQLQLPNVGQQSVVRRGKKYLEEALYRRLFKGGGSEQSVRAELNRFLKSHKLVYKWEVGLSLKKLRQRKRYDAALKVLALFAFRPFLLVSDLLSDAKDDIKFLSVVFAVHD